MIVYYVLTWKEGVIFWKANSFYVQPGKKESVNQGFVIQFTIQTLSVVFNIQYSIKDNFTDKKKKSKQFCAVFLIPLTTEWENEYGAVKKSYDHYI